MSLIEDIKNGQAQMEWADVVSQNIDGAALRISVMRDALKVNGVRVMADAVELQMAADELECSLLTPKVVDLIYQQAALRFDPVIRADGDIVASSTPARVSALIDDRIKTHGGDQGGIIDSIGKYWVLHNHLTSAAGLLYGKRTACNYGWLSTTGLYQAVTPGLKCWQSPGFRHNCQHKDPSQLVRLMKRRAVLVRPHGCEEAIDILDVLQDPTLAPLANHDGVLHYLRITAAPLIP
jgi:hypothetical protein